MIWSPGRNAGTLGSGTRLLAPSLPGGQRAAVARAQRVACLLWPGTAKRCLPQTSQWGARTAGRCSGPECLPRGAEGRLPGGGGGSCSRSKPSSGGGAGAMHVPSLGWGGWKESGTRLAGFLGCLHFIQMAGSVKHLEEVRPRPLSGGRSRGEAAPGAAMLLQPAGRCGQGRVDSWLLQGAFGRQKGRALVPGCGR